MKIIDIGEWQHRVAARSIDTNALNECHLLFYSIYLTLGDFWALFLFEAFALESFNFNTQLCEISIMSNQSMISNLYWKIALLSISILSQTFVEWKIKFFAFLLILSLETWFEEIIQESLSMKHSINAIYSANFSCQLR